jgi:ankyrin repeat protein
MGDVAAVARLLAAGAGPNVSVAVRYPSGEVFQTTALVQAAHHGRVEALRLLLDAGAELGRANSDGITPLMAAAGAGHLEVVRLLLARGAGVDAVYPGNGGTAFHNACYNSKAECAEALALAGCDVGIKDDIGRTGREIAEEKGHAEVLARLRAVVSDQLRVAQAAGAAPAPELEPGAEAGDEGQATQLALAAEEGDGAAVARLLAAGADPNAWVTGRNPSGEVVPTTPLVRAAGHGWLAVARLLLAAGADPSLATSVGSTPLLAAAVSGHSEVVRLLLGKGAAVDAVHPYSGGTAFHSACYTNQPECAEVLARAGCDVGLKDSEGMTGREVAEGEGHMAVVARLRAVVVDQLRAAQAAGAAPAPDREPAALAGDGGLADQLLMAAMEGDGVAVARLLAAGADPNAWVTGRNPSGEVFQTTALCAAAAHGRLEAARLLLDACADPSRAISDGSTPLMAAAATGHLEVVRLLLARGVALDAVHPFSGGAAFHSACYSNQAECAEALARAGCNVGLKDSQGKTGREVAEGEGHTAAVARLRAVVADQLQVVQAADAAPEPAADVAGDEGPADQRLRAAMEGYGAVVARLLAAGVDPNAWVVVQDASGEVGQTTALIQAAGHGRLEATRLLLEGGADPNRVGGDGSTPLMQAAGEGQLEVIRLLLVQGVAVDAARPESGWTAFHFACVTNQADCAEALARAGCDVGIKAKNGLTGREIAEAEGSKDAARRLRALARQPFVGVLVKLAGLVGAAEHNGRRATVRPGRAIACSLLCFVSALSLHVCVEVDCREVELTPPPR